MASQLAEPGVAGGHARLSELSLTVPSLFATKSAAVTPRANVMAKGMGLRIPVGDATICCHAIPVRIGPESETSNFSPNVRQIVSPFCRLPIDPP
jgi:hypothetical protein